MATSPATAQYMKIYEKLREEIIAGKWASEQRFASEPALVSRFKSSRNTVRSALTLLSAQGLITQKQGVGTFVTYGRADQKARKRVGMLVPWKCDVRTAGINYVNLHYGYLTQAIMEGLNDGGIDAELMQVHTSSPLMETFHRNLFDGLIISPNHSDIEPVLRLPLESVPHVLVSAGFREFADRGLYMVDTDNVAVLKQAVAHLRKLGHERILFLGGSEVRSNALDRRRGYIEGMLQSGLNQRNLWIVSTTDQTEGSLGSQLEDILCRPDRPTAVISSPLFLLSTLMKTVRKLAINIPEELSIIAICGYGIAENFHPSLTEIRQPIRELGNAAGRLLARQLVGERPVQKQLTISQEIVERESCAPVENKACMDGVAPFAKDKGRSRPRRRDLSAGVTK